MIQTYLNYIATPSAHRNVVSGVNLSSFSAFCLKFDNTIRKLASLDLNTQTIQVNGQFIQVGSYKLPKLFKLIVNYGHIYLNASAVRNGKFIAVASYEGEDDFLTPFEIEKFFDDFNAYQREGTVVVLEAIGQVTGQAFSNIDYVVVDGGVYHISQSGDEQQGQYAVFEYLGMDFNHYYSEIATRVSRLSDQEVLQWMLIQ